MAVGWKFLTLNQKQQINKATAHQKLIKLSYFRIHILDCSTPLVYKSILIYESYLSIFDAFYLWNWIKEGWIVIRTEQFGWKLIFSSLVRQDIVFLWYGMDAWYLERKN